MNTNDELKPFWKTTEFRSLVAILIGVFGDSLRNFNPTQLMVAFTLVGCGYVLARSFFKKNRQVLKYSATKASEFYVFMASATGTYAVGEMSGKGEIGIVLIAIQYLVYAIGRGVVKSLDSKNTTVQMIS